MPQYDSKPLSEWIEELKSFGVDPSYETYKKWVNANFDGMMSDLIHLKSQSCDIFAAMDLAAKSAIEAETRSQLQLEFESTEDEDALQELEKVVKKHGKDWYNSLPTPDFFLSDSLLEASLLDFLVKFTEVMSLLVGGDYRVYMSEEQANSMEAQEDTTAFSFRPSEGLVNKYPGIDPVQLEEAEVYKSIVEEATTIIREEHEKNGSVDSDKLAKQVIEEHLQENSDSEESADESWGSFDD